MRRQTIIFLIGALVVYIVVQMLLSFGLLNDFWRNLIFQGAVMAMVSLGLNLIYGINGQFSLGQWGFYAIGAYTSAEITYWWVNRASTQRMLVLLFVVLSAAAVIFLLRRQLSKIRGLDPLSAFTLYLIAIIAFGYLAVLLANLVEPAVTAAFMALPKPVALEIIFLIAVLTGGMLAAEVSFLFGLPVLTLGSDYFGIATLGFTIIVKVLLDNTDTMFGLEEMKGARGMIGIPKVTNWFWVFIFLLIMVLITRNLLQSSYGRAIVSIREDEIAAKAMGIDIAHYKNLTFVLGSLFAGIAGGLYAHYMAFLHPSTFNFIKSFDPMIIVVMGGLGSITGTITASFAWALVLEGALRIILPRGFETWRYVIYPLLLLLLMLLKPNGLFGNYEIPFLRSSLPPLKLSSRSGGAVREPVHISATAEPSPPAESSPSPKEASE